MTSVGNAPGYRETLSCEIGHVAAIDDVVGKSLRIQSSIVVSAPAPVSDTLDRI